MIPSNPFSARSLLLIATGLSGIACAPAAVEPPSRTADTPLAEAAEQRAGDAAPAVLASLDAAWTHEVDPDAARRDLDALYAGLRSAHYDLFANRTEAEYDALHTAMRATFDAPLSRFELLRALQRFAAFGDVAHARIDLPGEIYGEYRERGGKALPVYPRIDGNVVRVGQSLAGVPDLETGDRILAIDGVPMERWLSDMAEFIASDTPRIAHSMLEFTFPRDLWMLTGERDAHVLSVRKPDGQEIELRVPTLDAAAQTANAPDQADDKRPSLREARMATSSIAYLKPGPFYNAEDPARPWDVDGFTAFIDEAFADFATAGATELVIDLRDNPGGDNSFSDPMLAYIADEPFRFYSDFRIRSSAEAERSNAARLEASGNTTGVSARFAERYAQTPYGETFAFELDKVPPRDADRFAGEVFALIDRNSYSNAVNVASILQDYGWATIVGEATTDFATTYGSMESFELPESGFTVGFPKSLIVRPNGDATPGPVRPDVEIETPVGPEGNTRVLEALLERIEAGRL